MKLTERKHVYAQRLLSKPLTLVWLILSNFVALLIGVDFYVETMPDYSPFAWIFYLDSPAALFLALLSLTTLLPRAGEEFDATETETETNTAVTYLHTVAVVWLVKYSVWTAVALNLGFGEYYPEVWNYWGILFTHLLFLPEAYVLSAYSETTRGALVTSAVLLLLNDLFDYTTGLHPPLRYDPGLVLPAATVVVTGVSVVAAWLWMGTSSSGSG
ncbi:MAG: DUF1405 domain-containing protein [Halobacteria archaeon]|nr:DUF1405 domain-containing protein [Halobacteria archaeon]